MTDTTNEQGTEPQALPGDGLREGIVEELRRRLGESLVDVELRPNDDLWVRVATEAWAATGEALRSMGFTYFCFLSGLDWLPSPYGRSEENPDEPAPERSTEIVQGVVGGETRFQVFARVVDPVRHVGITVKADVDDQAPTIATWHTIWAGANWHERETHEMFGIGFAGHPDLRNMYLPGDFEGHPLRKDFPLLSRMIKPWPGIVDVEPMPAEDDEDGSGAAPTDAATSETAADATTTDAAAGDAAVGSGAADEAAGTDEAPVGEVTSQAGAAAGEAAATEAAATSPEEAPAFESTEQAESTEPAPTAEEPAARPVDAPADTVAEAAEPRPDAEADGVAEPVPDVESAPEEGTDVVSPATGEERWSPDIPVADVEGPAGVGSKDPRPDGSQPPDHPVKASRATMRFHVPGSEGYDELEPDVWFDSETTARAAGFVSPFEEPAEVDPGANRPGPGTAGAQMEDRDAARPDAGEDEG